MDIETGRQESGNCVETRRLNLWYGTFKALSDVNANVRHGIITSLIGPSGCGKTTLLRCINRMNERYPSVRVEGSLKVLGADVYAPAVSLIELRKAVGMVFQRPNPLPLSIFDNVVFGLRAHAAPGSLTRQDEEEAVEKALREVFLFDQVKDRLRRKAVGLQLEQQQKLCIARLLPLKPRILLMDEPCSALDAEGTEAVEDLMRSLRGKFSMIIVTHNMAQARRVSDECIFMLMGELVEHRPTAELFVNPRDHRTEAYVEGRYG